MQLEDKIAILEAILFASGEPAALEKLSAASGIEADTVPKLIKLLNDRYDNGALEVVKLGGGYQMVTKEAYADYIKVAMEQGRTVPLSPAAMEVLTIVAYNQPVTKGFVEHVRGVDSSSVVNALTEKNLLEEAGRLDVPGKPIAYRTTDTFLRSFQLSSIEELPPLPSGGGQVSFDEILIEKEADAED